MKYKPAGRPKESGSKKRPRYIPQTFSSSSIRNFVKTVEIRPETDPKDVSAKKTDPKALKQRKKAYHKLLEKYRQRNNSMSYALRTSDARQSKFIIEDKSFRTVEREFSKRSRSGNQPLTCRSRSPFGFLDPLNTKESFFAKTNDEFLRMKQKIMEGKE